MLRSIVVPLDGTSFSEEAIPVAATIASSSGAALELVLVHVHDSTDDDLATLTPYRYEQIDTDGQLRRDLELQAGEWQYLGEQADRIEVEFGAPANRLLIGGEIADALAAHVRQSSADLVVMTTHARGGLERTRLGSVADRLLHRLQVPVLLLHGQPNIRMPDHLFFCHVLITLDGSALAEQAIGPALSLASLSAAHVTLYTAITGNEGTSAAAYLDRVAERLRDHALNITTAVHYCDRAADGIAAFAEANGVDLIAIATHGRAGLSRLLIGSVADRVLHGTTIPMLLLCAHGAQQQAPLHESGAALQ